MLKKFLILTLFCVGCVPHIEVQEPQENSRIKVTAIKCISENTDAAIITIDNIEYVIICKNAYEGGVVIVKHEKLNKAEVE